MADIDLAGFDGKDGRPAFKIIAPDTETNQYDFQGTPFGGVFDGNGHTISHLTVTGKDYLGLFGQLASGGLVRDLGMIEVNITASGDYVGGLVGINRGVLTGCHSTGAVSGTVWDVGGLVGANVGHLAQCYSACAVSGGTQDVGGLMGLNSTNGIVTHCYSTGTVSGGHLVGGLVGINYGAVTACYSTGAVNGFSQVGGLVGDNSSNGHVTHSYSTGAVTGIVSVGGLVGVNWYDVTACFWDIQTSGQATSAGGDGKTTAEMQATATFLEAGWDFVNVWGIGENQTYPYIRKYSAADINEDASVNFLDLAVLAENWLTGIAP